MRDELDSPLNYIKSLPMARVFPLEKKGGWGQILFPASVGVIDSKRGWRLEIVLRL